MNLKLFPLDDHLDLMFNGRRVQTNRVSLFALREVIRAEH